ncbi:augmin complex subunit wac [Drosophila grimshawi]|nr:augmin complex subunit wac [Drosophila grimshawi]
MDNLKLQREVIALKRFANHLENTLKLVSIELSDLPDDVLMLLDKCVEIQASENLNELNLNYLREIYYCNKSEYIENKLTVAKHAATIKNLKKSIKESGMDIADLERFMSIVDKRIIPDAEQKLNIVEIDEKSKYFQFRQTEFNVPDNFSIESVIEKVELLEDK